ncbi:MAG: hypothetical protein HQL66_05275 [Magnetococcales bacterium]|nr:hypothetical protein [Magnetococcales bacterium]
MEKVEGWGEAFSRSPRFESLSDPEKAEAESVIMHFAEFMLDYLGREPEAWRTNDLWECCVEIIPRKVTAEEVYFRAVAPVLSSFFRYLDEAGLLLSAGSLAQEVERLGPKIVTNAVNPAFWGPAKKFAMKARAAGVDMSSQEDLDRFMLQYNQQLMEQRKLPGSMEAFDHSEPPLIGMPGNQRRKPVNTKAKRAMQKTSRRKNRR